MHADDVAGLRRCGLELGKLLAADVCGDERIDKKLGKAIGKTVGNVRGVLTKAAGASEKKQAKLVRKAARKLAALGKKAGKAKKTPATCRSTLTGLIASQRQARPGAGAAVARMPRTSARGGGRDR